MQTLTSPYPYRAQDLLCASFGITPKQAGDFTRAGFLLIFEKLEAKASDNAQAREALAAERRAYLILHGAVKPYSMAELGSPVRRPGELEAEFKARRTFQ